MKNKMLLTLALGLAGASSLMATTVDVYLTGSTAFRGNAFLAASNLFSSVPTIYFGDAAHGGAGSGFSPTTAAWVMSGTPVSTLTNLAGSTFVVHGLFTGSIQGVQAVENQQPLVFPDVSAGGTPNGLVNSGGYVTKAATIGFDDVSATITTYPPTGNYKEEEVGVIPFGIFKSVSSGAGATIMNNITNVSWEQMEYGIPAGRLPLSAWTYKKADTNTYIYLLQRTQDSGTRRSELADMYYQYNDPVAVYLLDATNISTGWYLPTVLNSVSTPTAFASAPYGVVGGGSANSANYNWGYGYVAGGDIKNSLNLTLATNTAIGYLSLGDGKAVGSSGVAFTKLLSFNGVWPTVVGPAIIGQANSATNDYTPITDGYYPLWGTEVIVFPKKPSLQADQNISDTQLGDQSQPGTFLGVFNAQTKTQPGLGGVPLLGSIEKTIEDSKISGATAIRLSDMQSKRSSPGGVISPR